MSTYCPADFCTPPQGLDFLFGKMSAIYGSAFTRHWNGIDISLVRQTWGEILGPYATYRPAIEFALKNMDKNFPPSALAFAELCKQSGRIPTKPHTLIVKQPTQAELTKSKNEAEIARAQLKRLIGKIIV